MCDIGQPWFGLQANACFRDEVGGGLLQCRCPISTCVIAPNGNASCQYSTWVVVIFAVLLACFWGVLFAWMNVGNRVNTLSRLRVSRRAIRSWAQQSLFPPTDYSDCI
jgi:hypothetical protein